MNLQKNKATGALPTELGKLTGMTAGMQFNDNSFTSPVPTELGQLVQMKSWMNFFSDSFTGPIPTELGRLDQMASYFRFHSNQLCDDVPTQVQALSSSVTANWAVTTGNSFGTMCKCDYGDSRFPELCSTTTATSIDYNQQGLTGTIPTQFGLLTDATSVLLYSNELTGSVPTELGLVIKVTKLTLSNNDITAQIPTQIGSLTSLVTGDDGCSDCGFLCSSQLSGTTPSELGRLSLLTFKMNLQENKLAGTLPTELGRLVQLKSNMIFRSNGFTGPMPTELGQLDQMAKNFQFYSNQLCDDMPTQVQALSSSVTSNWEVTTGNSIGTVCGWQSYMADSRFPTMDGSTSTTSITYSSQDLTGTIPSEFGLMESITNFWVNDNTLTGEIPSQLGQMTRTTKFVTYTNEFSPATPLPTQLGNLVNMKEYFHVGHCGLSNTTLPSELGKLVQMTSGFYAHANQFSSSIPTQIGAMVQLTAAFNIGANDLSSTCPTQLGRFTGLTFRFKIQSNRLCGEVPTEIEALSSQVTSDWLVTSGNSFGTFCPTPAPTSLPTPSPSLTKGPTSVPTQIPTPAPTTPLPTTPVPTPEPTTPRPTPVPTFICPAGKVMDVDAMECRECDNTKPKFQYSRTAGATGNCSAATSCYTEGTKSVDQITGKCICEDYYEGDTCDSMQDVATSMGLSYFISIVNIGIVVFLALYNGLHRITNSIFTRVENRKKRWCCQANLGDWVREQQRIYDDWVKRQKAKDTEPNTFESCLKALAVAVIVISTFFLFLAYDFFHLAINVYLISSSLKELYFSIPGFEGVVEVMERIGDAVEELCGQLDLQFLWAIYQLADRIASTLMGLFDDIFDWLSRGVTCTGAQAPLYVTLNLAIFLVVVVLYDSSISIVFDLVVDDMKRDRALESMKVCGSERIDKTIQNALFYAWIELVKQFEKGVKLTIQFLIGFTSYTAILSSKTNEYCDRNSSYSDSFLSVFAKLVFVVTAPPILHVLLNSLIYGGEDEIRALVKRWGFEGKVDDASHNDVARQSSFGKGTTEAIQRTCEREFMQDPRALWKFYVLELGKGQDEGDLKAIHLLRGFLLYTAVSFWKFWLFIKMTVGWWDKELLDIFDVKRRCQLIDLDQKKEPNSETLEKKMLAVLGETRSICWQLLGLTLVAKFGEAISEAPIFVWAERSRDNVKATDTSFFYDTDNNGLLTYSYFSLPLRGSAEDRVKAHSPDDRMTMDTPVLCRVILLGMLILQYLLMVILIFDPSMAAMVSWFTTSAIIAAIRQYAEKRSWVKLRNKDIENLEKLIEAVQQKGWEGFVSRMQLEPEAESETNTNPIHTDSVELGDLGQSAEAKAARQAAAAEAERQAQQQHRERMAVAREDDSRRCQNTLLALGFVLLALILGSVLMWLLFGWIAGIILWATAHGDWKIVGIVITALYITAACVYGTVKAGCMKEANSSQILGMVVVFALLAGFPTGIGLWAYAASHWGYGDMEVAGIVITSLYLVAGCGIGCIRAAKSDDDASLMRSAFGLLVMAGFPTGIGLWAYAASHWGYGDMEVAGIVITSIYLVGCCCVGCCVAASQDHVEPSCVAQGAGALLMVAGLPLGIFLWAYGANTWGGTDMMIAGIVITMLYVVACCCFAAVQAGDALPGILAAMAMFAGATGWIVGIALWAATSGGWQVTGIVITCLYIVAGCCAAASQAPEEAAQLLGLFMAFVVAFGWIGSIAMWAACSGACSTAGMWITLVYIAVAGFLYLIYAKGGG